MSIKPGELAALSGFVPPAKLKLSASGRPLANDSVREALQALEHGLRELPANKSPGLVTVGALKAVWAAARAQAAHINREMGGRETGLFLSDVTDQTLTLLLEHAARRSGFSLNMSGIALLAMGSYGRNELAPYSDLDMLVLYSGHGVERNDPRLEKLIGGFMRPLWDCGMNLGHAVRTPDECLEMMEADDADGRGLETATALLEARYVTGDSVLAKLFLKNDLSDFFRQRGRIFVESKLREAIERHHRRGVSVYGTQPNLKESPGALRDYQLALWIDRASQLSGHLPRLAKHPLVSSEAIADARAGYDRILTMRCALHSLCGKKQEILDFGSQQHVAKELGIDSTEEFRASELLLRDYFHAATKVHFLAQVVIRRYREEQALAERNIDLLRRRPLDRDFMRIGDNLYLAREGVLEGKDWLLVAMRAFWHATRLGIDLSQEIRQGIHDRLDEMDEALRGDKDAAARFMAILAHRANVARTLRSMRDIGFLAAYMPEFKQIEDLVIHDVLHDFTVDEHTLFVVEYVDKLFASGDPNERLQRGVLERLPNPAVLRMACLFHDLGKSRGGPGHSKRGALMVPQIAERWGIGERDTRLLIWLVENHLLLSRTSQRRDLGDPKLIEELVDKIQNRERLALLYLLTLADIKGVGQGAFTHWKDDLLRSLFLRLDEILDPALRPRAVARQHDTESLKAALLEAVPAEDRALAEAHCARVPPRYLVEVNLEQAKLHLKLLKALAAEDKQTLVANEGAGALCDIWVVSQDRPNLFASIAGAFLGHGVNVVDAIAYTCSDGLIIDHFRAGVAPEFRGPGSEGDAAFWMRICGEIESTLHGKTDFRTKIEAARRRIPHTPSINRSVAPEVRLDNKISDGFTVVDVACGDRIGLLYGMSRALFDLGCTIHFAKVETTQGLVHAVFYVTTLEGGQLTDPEKMHSVRLLLRTVADEFQASRR